MLILLEGPDGGGKSTLWNKLREDGYITVRVEKQCKDQVDFYRNLKGLFNNYVICDRSFLSDVIYSCIENRPCKYTASNLEWLLNDSKIIYCANDTMKDDMLGRGDDNPTVQNHFSEIVNWYDTVIKLIEQTSASKVLHYDWRNTKYEDVVKFIEED